METYSNGRDDTFLDKPESGTWPLESFQDYVMLDKKWSLAGTKRRGPASLEAEIIEPGRGIRVTKQAPWVQLRTL